MFNTIYDYVLCFALNYAMGQSIALRFFLNNLSFIISFSIWIVHTFFWHKFILIELFVFTFYKFSLSLSCIECVKKTKFNCCNNITNSRLFIFSFIFWKYLKICFRFAFCSLPSDSHSQSVFSGFSFGHHTYVFDVKSDEKLRKKKSFLLKYFDWSTRYKENKTNLLLTPHTINMPMTSSLRL